MSTVDMLFRELFIHYKLKMKTWSKLDVGPRSSPVPHFLLATPEFLVADCCFFFNGQTFCHSSDVIFPKGLSHFLSSEVIICTNTGLQLQPFHQSFITFQVDLQLSLCLHFCLKGILHRIFWGKKTSMTNTDTLDREANQKHQYFTTQQTTISLTANDTSCIVCL